MTFRRWLPNRRHGETFSFEWNGLRYTATISRFEDGRIAELFLSNRKSGSQADASARDAAIILSFALQYGADIDAIRARCLATPAAGQIVRLVRYSISSTAGPLDLIAPQ